MIKFVIGFIALIFVALAVYTYTDKKVEVVTKSAVTNKVEKTDVLENKIEKSIEMTKEVNLSIKQHIKMKIDFSELANEDVDVVDKQKTSDDAISDKEWNDIENSLDLSHKESLGQAKYLLDNELVIVNTELDNKELNLTSNTSLSEEEWKAIEVTLPEQERAEIQSIENDDLVERLEN